MPGKSIPAKEAFKRYNFFHKGKKMSYFRYILVPKFLWYATGRFITEAIYDFWWVRIVKRGPVWPDEDANSCPKRYCRTCGKGSDMPKRP